MSGLRDRFRWRSCERKRRYDEEPSALKGTYSYRCSFCDGWHRATDRRIKLPTIKQPAAVLRGGYWMEK